MLRPRYPIRHILTVCLKPGHWTFDCKNERTYRPRPSRTALLANPELRLPEADLTADYEKERNQVVQSVLEKTETESDGETEDDLTDDTASSSGSDSDGEVESDGYTSDNTSASSTFSSDTDEDEESRKRAKGSITHRIGQYSITTMIAQPTMTSEEIINLENTHGAHKYTQD
ncbi:hypothetical protein PSACC_00821 [Paramicrosporidium saccamoebae]|uniref:Uncharacterized protein n=1 Tax=Paramicrosporidium saccamoebae TaxID=1246581 RepID=A0A2H9TNM5_9FUNG|nr:hypothetical protein PSACC_00821 [Paramicrosporidium saccamoebae]